MTIRSHLSEEISEPKIFRLDVQNGGKFAFLSPPEILEPYPRMQVVWPKSTAMWDETPRNWRMGDWRQRHGYGTGRAPSLWGCVVARSKRVYVLPDVRSMSTCQQPSKARGGTEDPCVDRFGPTSKQTNTSVSELNPSASTHSPSLDWRFFFLRRP
jgi:hypothetical protein